MFAFGEMTIKGAMFCEWVNNRWFDRCFLFCLAQSAQNQAQ